MPELPEVETIVRNLRDGHPRQLAREPAPQGAGATRRVAEPPGGGYSNGKAPSLLGMTITRAEVLWPRTLATPSPEAFLRRITGKTIADIQRRGKYLVFRLGADTMLIHLRMSGDLLVEPPDAPAAPHHRLIIDLENPESERRLRLAFNDTRKFGRVWLVTDPATILGKLGPEPLDPSFTPGQLFRKLQSHRRQLKPLLLDQSFLAGLGNIYTDEALYQAQLHPQTPSNEVTQAEAARLWEAIRQVLRAGIRNNGASIDWVYRGGEFQNHFKAYGRTAEPCERCGTPIARIVVGQRGTHYCPTCQPGRKR